MKAEQAKKLADNALEQLAEALDAGKSDALSRYLAMLARFHHYSFGNVLLIATQRPDATHVAGFRTWKKLGRYVKKGEKGIVIIAPMLIRKRDEDRDDDADATVLRFRGVHVFDVAQTDGEALPEPTSVQGDPGVHLHRLKAHVADLSIVLEYRDDLGSASGASTGGRILLRNGQEPAEEFSTLVHELAHEVLHRRDGETRPSKTVRETEAEAVAFVVAHAVGLETGTAASDYIQVYAGDKETLAASLDRIQQAASAIILAVTEDQQQQQAA